MAKILAIDDDIRILRLIENALRKDNHTVTIVHSPLDLDFTRIKDFELIILDIMMPHIDGYTLCEKIRELVDCPIIFLTAKTMEQDVIYGLGIGGDDYIKKPFSIGELRARVNAHLRREKRERKNCLFLSGMKIDLAGKEIFVGDQKVPLTKSEYEICTFLAQNRGQVFAREQIYEKVYGFDGESDSSTISEHIKNVRAKFNQFDLAPIETVWGIGYKWKKEL